MEDANNIVKFIRLAGVLPAVIVLFATWIVVQGTASFFRRLGDRFTERRLLLQQVGTVVRFAFYFAGIAAATLLVFRLSEQMLIAVGGTLAVAIGIAMKDLAASILAGLMILFDRPFQVGDRVSFGGQYGEITAIGLRSVRMVTLDDNQITIPNNKFLTDLVASGNAGALDMLVQMDFFVGIDQDVDAAKAVVRGALTSTRYAYLAKPWSVQVTQGIFDGYFAVRLRAKVYVFDVQYEKALEGDVSERVLRGLREQRVLPPAVLYRAVGDTPIQA
jgi:small-conductance mechanosensitive channel